MSVNPTHKPESIAGYCAELLVHARCRGHRGIVVLTGTREWSREAAVQTMSTLGLSRRVWLGEMPSLSDYLEVGTARQLLGQELDGVVLDAWAGFDAEAFGALAGTLRAGGLMLLLAPPLAQWRDYPDPEHVRLAVAPYTAEQVTGRFLHHLSRSVQGCPGVVQLGQDGELPPIAEGGAPCWQPPFSGEGMTPGQADVQTAIERVAHGHRRRPLVLTADRGRGKSAALGIAAAGLLQRGSSHITVTAPSLSAAAQVFAHAERLLPGAKSQRGLLEWQGKHIVFVPPDALTLAPHATELLLVDEAAAIPTPLLERMLLRYARIVFASTIHGYEGTGRGFALRFQKVLTQRNPGWQAVHLQQPVRWALDDPLERLSFRALMLDAEPVKVESLGRVEPGGFAWIDRDNLVEDASMLAELFGLLVLAHYRTSPNDLRYLMDGPNVRIAVLRQQGHVIATALIAEEGGLSAALAKGIYEGRRRAHGHLLPQSLAVHAGFVEAPQLKAWRVVRIAVHPGLVRRGLGRYLLRQIQHEAQREGMDFIGASFGAEEGLLAFWHDAGWGAVRVGLGREASSGTHSVMMLQPLSDDGKRVFQKMQARLAEQLPLLLGDSLSQLDAALVVALLRQLPMPLSLGELDWRDIHSFAEALRGYEVCLLALWRLAPAALADATIQSRLDDSEQQLLVQRVLQQHDWAVLAKAHGLSGRAQVVEALRGCYRTLLLAYRDAGRLPGA